MEKKEILFFPHACRSSAWLPAMTATKRVLVVDDIASHRVLAQAVLEHLGWTVLTAVDGRAALGVLAADHVDLVLLDISMPGMSGIEVCQNIRANPALADVPVIAYTVHAQAEDRRNFIASGFDEVLIKPINRDALSGALAAMSRQHSLRSDLDEAPR